MCKYVDKCYNDFAENEHVKQIIKNYYAKLFVLKYLFIWSTILLGIEILILEIKAIHLANLITIHISKLHFFLIHKYFQTQFWV